MIKRALLSAKKEERIFTQCTPSSVSIHQKILGGDSSSCLLDLISGMAEHFPFLMHLTTADALEGYKIAFMLKLVIVIALKGAKCYKKKKRLLSI